MQDLCELLSKALFKLISRALFELFASSDELDDFLGALGLEKLKLKKVANSFSFQKRYANTVEEKTVNTPST